MPYNSEDCILSFKERVSFLDRLVSDFIHSVEKVRISEIDFQRFVDENPFSTHPSELPETPTKSTFLRYCVNSGFTHPQFLPPLSEEIRYLSYLGTFSHEKIFLGLVVCFASLPAFNAPKPQKYEDLVTYSQKEEELKRLISVLVSAQSFFAGKINGTLYMGLDFLCQLTKEYGITLRFKEEGKKLRPIRAWKNDRHFREPATVIRYLRKHSSALEDFSSFAKNINWCHVGLVSLEYMTIYEGVQKLLRNSKSSDALSLVSLFWN